MGTRFRRFRTIIHKVGLILALYPLTLSTACNSQNKVSTLEADGLPEKFNSKSLVQFADGRIYLSGETTNENGQLYRSEDGGSSWTLLYQGNGTIDQLVQTDIALYAVKNTFLDDLTLESAIIISYNDGDSWEEINPTSASSLKLYRVIWINDTTGLAFASTPTGNKLFTTEDSGKNWSSNSALKSFKSFDYDMIFSWKGSTIGIARKAYSKDSRQLFTWNMTTDSFRTIELSEYFTELISLSFSGDQPYLIGRTLHGIDVYLISENGTIEKIEEFQVNAKELITCYYSNEHLFYILQKCNMDTFAGDCEYKLLSTQQDKEPKVIISSFKDLLPYSFGEDSFLQFSDDQTLSKVDLRN